MSGLSVFMLALCAGAQEDPNKLVPGPAVVQVQNAWYSKVPSATRGLLRKAAREDAVTVVALEGSFAKVTLADGTGAFVPASALIAKDKYQRGPANEKEMGEMKAQGYEAGRFDPETEKEYTRQKGPEMATAYRQVDELERRLTWTHDRAALSARLESFRKAGRLGEFSSVK